MAVSDLERSMASMGRAAETDTAQTCAARCCARAAGRMTVSNVPATTSAEEGLRRLARYAKPSVGWGYSQDYDCMSRAVTRLIAEHRRLCAEVERLVAEVDRLRGVPVADDTWEDWVTVGGVLYVREREANAEIERLTARLAKAYATATPAGDGVYLDGEACDLIERAIAGDAPGAQPEEDDRE